MTIPAERPVIVVGLGFGDESKGATVDHLCASRPGATVVRFNGGMQAAHNVVTGDLHHTFRQFGSGTLSGAATHLSRHMLIDPPSLADESEQLARLGVADALSLVTVDRDALLTTPVHIAANRTREDLRGVSAHGSCGLGIGETSWYDLATKAKVVAGARLGNFQAPSDTTGRALRVRDCLDPRTLRRRLTEMSSFYAPLLATGGHHHESVADMATLYEEFVRTIRVVGPGHLAAQADRGPLVFEGAQGVLLDEWRGFHPYTTWSTTVPRKAQRLLAAAGLGRGYVLGVTRGYGTRHGVGPFPTEEPSLHALLAEPHNGYGTYQGSWRVGHLDLVALRYSVQMCREVDGIALGHLDQIGATGGAVRAATSYVVDGRRVDRLPVGRWRDLDHQERLTNLLECATPELTPMPTVDECVRLVETLGAPVEVMGFGPAREDRKYT